MSSPAAVPSPEGSDQVPSPEGLDAPPPAWSSPEEAPQAAVDRLSDRIARLSAHIQAATYRLLVLIRAFDRAEGWHRAGFTSCAAWLSWRTGVGAGAAREKVRVARALAELPVLSGALERGELSYSAARALTRVATAENEGELVEVARHATAAELERLVRAWRGAERAEAEERAEEAVRHADRELHLVADGNGSWRIRGRLDPEVGAMLRAALEAAGEALYRGEADDREAPASARRADALGLVAEAALGEGLGTSAAEENEQDAAETGDLEQDAAALARPTPEDAGDEGEIGDGAADEDEATALPVVGRAGRFQVVVHVDAETLVRGDDGGSAETSAANGNGAGGAGESVSAETPGDPPHIARGPALARATARRLACDAGRVAMIHDRDGSVLDVGRRTRTVPPALRRALDHRDRGCRFPGCGARFCDAHHLTPWAEGGATRLDNLVLLCRRHHRRVHEDGWRLELLENETTADGRPAVRVHRPDGRHLPRVPPAPDVPDTPAAALERRQRHLGIDARTATPDADGVPLDVDFALYALMPPLEANEPDEGDDDAGGG